MITPDSDYLFLELKPSTISNAGIGVFAKEDIEEDSIIAEYRGTITTLDEQIIRASDKCIILCDDKIIVGNNCVASLINDAIFFKDSYTHEEFKDITDIKKFPLHKNYNCKSSWLKHKKVFITSIRPIKKGEELFYSYGFNYWLVRANVD